MGEVSSTGAHGANRLASNSLLEAVVFSARIADDISSFLPAPVLIPWSDGSLTHEDAEPAEDTEVMTRLRQTMSAEFGVVRDKAGMLQGLQTILDIETNKSKAEI